MRVRVPDGYEIGLARAHELPHLPEIERAASAMFSVEDLPAERRNVMMPVSFLEQTAARGRLWVARLLAPPTPVGFAAATLVDGSAHLFEMDVLPEHGRRGLGRALVLHVARWARAAGFASLTLTTFRHVPWNAPFYARLGFSSLEACDWGQQLRNVLAKEAALGLDPTRRVAMKLDLHSA